jgi:hypothetical protein
MEIKKTGSWNENCHLLPSAFHAGALFRLYLKKGEVGVITELVMLSSASQQNHLLIIQTRSNSS